MPSARKSAPPKPKAPGKRTAVPHGPSEGKGKPAASKPSTKGKTAPAKKSATRTPRGGAAAFGPYQLRLQADIQAAAQAGYPFYVYALSDDDGVFYIGKGQRNRVFAHGKRGDKSNAAKLLRIASAGLVVREVLAYFNCERASLDCERERIAELREHLTNIASGGTHQDPRQAASDFAASLLAQAVPLEQYNPPPWLTDKASARKAYALFLDALRREVAMPTPSVIELDHDARTATYCYGTERQAAMPRNRVTIAWGAIHG
jgi:hypothetical protein